MIGCIEYDGSKPSAVRPGPPKACRSCWSTSLDPLAAHRFSVVSATPVARVRYAARAARSATRVAVGVAVQRRGGLGAPPRRRRDQRRRRRVRVLVGVERDRDVQLRRAVGAAAAQVVAQRQVVEGHAGADHDRSLGGSRRRSAPSRPGRARAGPRRRRGRRRGRPPRASASRGVVDDVDAAQERLHGQARRVPRAAAGGQHVVGAGAVVAERDRAVRADEDRAGVAHPGGDRARRRRSGSPGARRRRRRPPASPSSTADTRTPPDCVPRSAVGDPLGVLGGRRPGASSSASTASASSTESVTSTLAASGSCSAWLIRSAATCTGSAVSSARIAISVGPASESMPISPRSSRFAAVT